MFGFIILVLTLLAAVGATALALKLPDYLQQWRFITGGIAVGLLLSTMFYWQQMRSANRAVQDAIAETSNRVADETTKRVTDEVSQRYQQQIRSLSRQVGDLELQLPGQNTKVNVVGNTSAVAPGKTTGAGATNIYWIQSSESLGKGSAEVQFRIYAPLNIPAFVAICDHPCRAVSGQAGAGSEGFPLAGSSDRDVAGFLFKKPKPMPAGTEGTVTLQSSDREPIQITAFRILRESEVPADLK